MKLQTSVEFVTTYVWAILIIVLVIAVLYGLGVFKGSTSLTSVCTPTAGFTCTAPALYSSGALSVTLGSVGNPITIIGLGCSHNQTVPGGIAPTNIALNPGTSRQVNFSCMIPNTAIGSSFSGSLWIVYNSGSQTGIVQQVASVNVHVQSLQASTILLTTSTSTTTTTSTSTIHYMQIILTNSQSGATNTPFQQMIAFNPSNSAYNAYEAGDLGNIRFYSSNAVPIAANELYSWCESGCTSGSSNAVFWVKLPNGIGANSNAIVNMTFQATSTEYEDNYAGEAPQLSGTYAQYDNGGSIFNNYWNGNQLTNAIIPSGWVGTLSTCTNYNTAINVPFIVEAIAKYPTSGSGLYINVPIISTASGGSLGSWVGIGNNAGSSWFYLRDVGNPSLAQLSSYTTNSVIFSLLAISSSSTKGQDNYGTTSTDTTSLASSSYVGICSGSKLIKTDWYRTRTYPPNGMMPSVKQGPAN